MWRQSALVIITIIISSSTISHSYLTSLKHDPQREAQ